MNSFKCFLTYTGNEIPKKTLQLLTLSYAIATIYLENLNWSDATILTLCQQNRRVLV